MAKLFANDIDCDWSPDGRHVAFGGRGTHAIVNIKTGKVDQESAPQVARQSTAFNYDGSLIAYSSYDSNQTVLAKRGGDVIARFPGAGYGTRPEFSPDGRWLAWHVTRKGQANMWLLDLTEDVLSPVSLLKTERRAFGALGFSPHSKYLLYSRGNDAADELVLLSLQEGKEQVEQFGPDP